MGIIIFNLKNPDPNYFAFRYQTKLAMEGCEAEPQAHLFSRSPPCTQNPRKLLQQSGVKLYCPHAPFVHGASFSADSITSRQQRAVEDDNDTAY